ncbi:MAG: T9SS type A sorting domain-containing protein [Candidatus Marinimicrobia bacterium]|nr:T9SS type A sorting domain-containing protein [Candidatus Neomarinimicrobiota bacterium]
MKKRFLISLMVVMAIFLFTSNAFAQHTIKISGRAEMDGIQANQTSLSYTVEARINLGASYSWLPVTGAGLNWDWEDDVETDSFSVEIDSNMIDGADSIRITLRPLTGVSATPSSLTSAMGYSVGWGGLSFDSTAATTDQDSVFQVATTGGNPFEFFSLPEVATDSLGVLPDMNYTPTRLVLACHDSVGSTVLGRGLRIDISIANDAATYGASQITELRISARDFTTKAAIGNDTLVVPKNAANDSLFISDDIVGGGTTWDAFLDSLAANGATRVDFSVAMISVNGTTMATIATTNGVWIDREGPAAPTYDDIVIRNAGGTVVDFGLTPLMEGQVYTIEVTSTDAISSLSEASIVFNYHGAANVLGLPAAGSQATLDMDDAVISGAGHVITFTFTPDDGIGQTPFWYAMQLNMEFIDINGNVTTAMNDNVTHWTLLNRNVFVTGVEISDYTKDPDDPDTLEWGNVYRIVGNDFAVEHMGATINFIALRDGLDEEDGVFVTTPGSNWFKLNGDVLSACLMAGASDTTFAPGWQYYIMGMNSMNGNNYIPWGDVFVSNYAYDGVDSLGWAGVRDLAGNLAGMIDSIFVHDSRYPELTIISFEGEDVDTVNSWIIADTVSGDNIHEHTVYINVDAVKDTNGLAKVQIWYRKHEEDPACYPDKCEWILLTTVNTDTVPWQFDVDLSKLNFEARRYQFAAIGIDDRDVIGNYFGPNRQPIEPQADLYIERGEAAPTGTIAAVVTPFEFGGTNKVHWTVADDFFVKTASVTCAATGQNTALAVAGKASDAADLTVTGLTTAHIGTNLTYVLTVQDYFGTVRTFNVVVPVVNEVVDVVIDSLNNGVPMVGWPWPGDAFDDLEDEDLPVHIHGDSVNVFFTVDDANTPVQLWTKVGVAGTWAKLGTAVAAGGYYHNWNVNALTDADTIYIGGTYSASGSDKIVAGNVLKVVVDHYGFAAGDVSCNLTAGQYVTNTTDITVSTTLNDLANPYTLSGSMGSANWGSKVNDFANGKADGPLTVSVTGTDLSVPNVNNGSATLVSVVVDNLVPVVDEFTVNEKPMSVAEISAGNAVFELTVSDAGSGIDAIFAYIELDYDDGQTAEDSVLFEVTGLGGLDEYTITNTIDVSTWAKDTFQIYLEVTDKYGRTLEDNTHKFSILENNTLPIPVIAAIDEHDQENEDCSVTLYAFTGLCLPNNYQKEPDHLRFEYKNGNGVWIEFGNVDFDASTAGPNGKFRVWPIEFNYDSEDGGYYDEEVRAVAVSDAFEDDMGETPYPFLEVAGPALVPHTVYDNNRKAMNDADQKLYSDNAVESPTNVVLVLTESNESGPQGNTINHFQLVSTELINGMYRGMLDVEPNSVLAAAPSAGTVTVWSFSSYNINQPTFTYTLNAGVMDVTKLYDAHDQVAVSYCGAMTVEVDASAISSDELVYFEPFRNKTRNGVHIHTTLADEIDVPFTMIHNTDISGMTLPALKVWRWGENADGIMTWLNEVEIDTVLDDTVYATSVSAQGTGSFIGTFKNDAIYAISVYDAYVPPTPYSGPVANFALLDYNGAVNGLDDDHTGYAPHSVIFGICGNGTDCAGDNIYYTLASGQGAGAAKDHEITFIFDGEHQITFMADECCKDVAWEDSYTGLVDSTYGNAMFTYMTPGSYDVTMIINDTKGHGADTLTIEDFIIVHDKALAIDLVTMLPSYSNAEGKTYTSKTPSFEVQVVYPQSEESELKAHAFLNGHHVLFQDATKEAFDWVDFANLEATLTIENESGEALNRFLKEDEANEIYFVVYDEAAGLSVTSETLTFWLDMTTPLVACYDEDEDWILGTHGSNSHDVWVFAEVKDPESLIRLTNCSMTIGQKNDTNDIVTYVGEAFDIIEEYADGFKLRKAINFADFNHAIWEDETFSNDMTISFTFANRLGMTTTAEYDFSFDLLDPIATVDDDAWPMVPTDSIPYDNDGDSLANEDPIDGINNDGDWHDVNLNGRRDYYFQTWCEVVYDCCGYVVDTICHKEVMLEEEYIDEDPIDWEYTYYQYEVDCNSGLSLHLYAYDPEECRGSCQEQEYGSGNIWSAASGIDHESFKLYLDGELLDATMDENGAVVGGQDNIPHGHHQIMLSVSDHAGRSANPLRFRIKANHDVAIVDEPIAPEKFELGDNYPNPFNPTTNIKLSIAKQTDVTLTVYDLMGKKVREMSWTNMETGYHTVNFDAQGLATGVYIYTLKAGNFVDTKKMILLK